MKKYTKFALAALASTLISASSYALTYDASVNGLFTTGGVVHTAAGGDLVVATKKGVTILGVSLGRSGQEIDLGQSIEIVFQNEVLFKSLTIGLLFDGPEYGDNFEIAAADADGNVHTLQALSVDQAEWLFDGNAVAGAVVNNLSPATIDGGAVWEILNPFGAMRVTRLLLYPQSSNPNGNESDFGLVGYEVPDTSSTLVLLGAGLFGLTFFGRRVRS